MPGWMKQKLESKAGRNISNLRYADEAKASQQKLGEISVTSDMQMTPSLWQKTKRK